MIKCTHETYARVLKHARDAEIPQEHHDPPFGVWLGEEHIIGLDISMQD